MPNNTAQWLSPRKVRNHYHLRLQNSEDMMRIGRLLTGNGVGLVLSGGGGRAMAHTGVIRALVEKGIPIDVISGVSAGAIVAGLWAMGLDINSVTKRLREAAGNRIDYTLPLHALTAGKNWTNAMRSLFGNECIEDLWIPFFTLSSNLSQASLKLHESNSLMHAIRASTAIPGILPPVYDKGDILVDGGLINNLPTDIMNVRPDIGHVIAVDVGSGEHNKNIAQFDYHISGWNSLWKQINPLSSPTEHPSIGEIIVRSITITDAKTTQVTKRIADLYFDLPVQKFGLMDYHKIDALAEIGYQYAIEEITAWKKSRDT